MAMMLSKSDYMLFLRHPAWLWLKKHDKRKLPEVDAAQQAMFAAGHLFEKYAEQLFPESIPLGFNNFSEYLSLPKRTARALQSGAKTILQGRFEAGQITCIIDVLDRVGENEFDLYEIKSSTAAKLEHEYDLAFQVVVLENCGLKIRQMKVIHVNTQYVRNGEIDMRAITNTADVTEAVRGRIAETKKMIGEALTTMNSSTAPGFSPRFVRMGPIGEWLTIYKGISGETDPYSIYHLATIQPKLIGELEDLGITLLQDIPETIALTEKQKRQVQVTKQQRRIIDAKQIRDFLGQVVYPLYFFDYETFSSVIPPFDGIKPYQQVPFQYSLHIISEPNAQLEHKEFLHTENSHPGLPLLQKLKEDIGTEGTIFVWYEQFEKSRNRELGEMFPEYAEFLQGVNDRIVDLMLPFAEGWFVDKDFFGSASIKKVLPVLVSELSYKNLAIREGVSAQRIWMETVLLGRQINLKEKILGELLEYCKMDTLAMVQLYRFLMVEISMENR